MLRFFPVPPASERALRIKVLRPETRFRRGLRYPKQRARLLYSRFEAELALSPYLYPSVLGIVWGPLLRPFHICSAPDLALSRY